MAERLNRAAVVRRGAELADEVGLDQVTITRLARAVGIAPPGVYRHVADVEDLRRAIATDAATEVAGLLSAATSGLAGEDALGALATTLHSWSREHPGRYAALQVAPRPDDAEHEAAGEALVAVIAAALRGYRLADADLVDAVRMLRSLLHGFIALEHADGFALPQDTARSFERLVRSLDVVLRSWSTPLRGSPVVPTSPAPLPPAPLPPAPLPPNAG